MELKVGDRVRIKNRRGRHWNSEAELGYKVEIVEEEKTDGRE